jgi:hypothetical protein
MKSVRCCLTICIEDNIQQIWREMKAQGYPHSDRALRAHLEPLCGRVKADFPEASSLDHFSAKEAVWLFIRHVDDLNEKEREELATIRQAMLPLGRISPRDTDQGNEQRCRAFWK